MKWLFPPYIPGEYYKDMTQIQKLSKEEKKYADLITGAAKIRTCQYCGKVSKTTSGHTLHVKSCKVAVQCKEDEALCKIGDVAIVGKIKTVVHMVNGLAVLSDNSVMSVSQLAPVVAYYAKKKAALHGSSRPVVADVGWPHGVKPVLIPLEEWIDECIKRCVGREEKVSADSIVKYIGMLHRNTNYTTFRGWSNECANESKLKDYIKKRMKEKKVKI